jgi:hypothetical protein
MPVVIGLLNVRRATCSDTKHCSSQFCCIYFSKVGMQLTAQSNWESAKWYDSPVSPNLSKRSVVKKAARAQWRCKCLTPRMLRHSGSLVVWTHSISNPFACHCIRCWGYWKWRRLVKVCVSFIPIPVQNQPVRAWVGPAVTCITRSLSYLGIIGSSVQWPWNIQKKYVTEQKR